MMVSTVHASDILIGFALSVSVFILGTLVIFSIYLKKKHNQYSHIPGPARTSFFCGNAGELQQAKKREVVLAEVLLRWVEEHGSTIHFFIFHNPVVFTANPTLVKELLVSQNLPKPDALVDQLSEHRGIRFLGRGMSAEPEQSVVSQRRSAISQFFHKNGSKDVMKASNPLNQVGNDMVYWIRGEITGANKRRRLEREKKMKEEIEKENRHKEKLEIQNKLKKQKKKRKPPTLEEKQRLSDKESGKESQESSVKCSEEEEEDISLTEEEDDLLKSDCMEKELNISDIVHKASLDCIAKVCFNMNISSVLQQDIPLLEALDIATKDVYLQQPSHMYSFKGILNAVCPWKGRYTREYETALNLLRQTACYCLTMRERSENAEKTRDVLTHLIQLRRKHKGSSPYVYVDDFVNVLISGKDSIANTTLLALLEVLRHPNVLEKLREEISLNVDSKRQICVDELSKLQYVQCVIKETMRLYPARSTIYRWTIERVTHEGTLMEIPANTNVMMSSYVSSRLSTLIKEGSDFRPERFLNSSLYRPRPDAFLPFSLGSRSCIGQQLGTLASSMILVKLLQKFDFNLNADQSFDISEGFTLRPIAPVKCRVKIRPTTKVSKSDLNHNVTTKLEQ